MSEPRRRFSNDEKLNALRRVLLDKTPVSDLCDELGLSPVVFYRWQKHFFENGAAAFDSQKRLTHQSLLAKIARLEAALVRRAEVIAHLLEAQLEPEDTTRHP